MNILGYNFNDKKFILPELRKIYGIGNKSSKIILRKLNIIDKRIMDLNNIEISMLKSELKTLLIGEKLLCKIRENINNLVEICCYRGIRHKMGMPVRGQRTKTNAKTAKLLNRVPR